MCNEFVTGGMGIYLKFSSTGYYHNVAHRKYGWQKPGREYEGIEETPTFTLGRGGL